MTNEQLYFAVGLPMLVNSIFYVLIVAYVNAKFNGLRTEFAQRFEAIEKRLDTMERHFDARFDNMRDLWRAELHRVEEILDARLKHLEERS